MVLACTVAGVSCAIDDRTLRVAEVAGGIHVLDVDVTSADGSVRPAEDADIVVTRDGTTIFGGLIETPAEAGFGGVGLDPITTAVHAQCYNALPARLVVTVDLPAGTLKAALTTLCVYLNGAFDTTLSATQVDGPSLPAMSFTDARLSDVLKAVQDAASVEAGTGYIVEIDYENVLSGYAAASNTAPWVVTDGDGNLDGDLEKEVSRTNYANHLKVWCGAAGRTDTVTHTWTADASHAYALDGLNIPASATWPGVVSVDGATYPMWPAGTAPGGNGIEWDYATDGGTLSFLGTAAALDTVGAAIALTYLPMSPFEVTAWDVGEIAAHKLKQDVATAEWVTTWELGQLVAAGELAKRIASAQQTVRYTTHRDGLSAGQVQTIGSARRGVSSGTFTLAQITVSDAGARLRYDVTAVRGTTLVNTFRDDYKRWYGTSSASANIVISGGSGGGSSTTTLSSPAYLGGSRIASVPMGASPVYTPVLSWVPFYAAATFTGRVRVELWARTAGVGVTARLYDVTASAAVGTSSAVTSTTPVETTFAAVLTAGHAYRLEIISDTASESAYGIGQLEAA